MEALGGGAVSYERGIPVHALFERDDTHPYHTVEYDPFIKSQLESHNEPQGVIRWKNGHVALQTMVSTKPTHSTVRSPS